MILLENTDFGFAEKIKVFKYKNVDFNILSLYFCSQYTSHVNGYWHVYHK